MSSRYVSSAKYCADNKDSQSQLILVSFKYNTNLILISFKYNTKKKNVNAVLSEGTASDIISLTMHLNLALTLT